VNIWLIFIHILYFLPSVNIWFSYTYYIFCHRWIFDLFSYTYYIFCHRWIFNLISYTYYIFCHRWIFDLFSYTYYIFCDRWIFDLFSYTYYIFCHRWIFDLFSYTYYIFCHQWIFDLLSLESCCQELVSWGKKMCWIWIWSRNFLRTTAEASQNRSCSENRCSGTRKSEKSIAGKMTAKNCFWGQNERWNRIWWNFLLKMCSRCSKMSTSDVCVFQVQNYGCVWEELQNAHQLPRRYRCHIRKERKKLHKTYRFDFWMQHAPLPTGDDTCPRSREIADCCHEIWCLSDQIQTGYAPIVRQLTLWSPFEQQHMLAIRSFFARNYRKPDGEAIQQENRHKYGCSSCNEGSRLRHMPHTCSSCITRQPKSAF